MFRWSRFNGYEVSSAGDSRFSAFNARVESLGGRSIEQIYQCDVKGYDPGGTNWRLGKGKPPLQDLSPEELYRQYRGLWVLWAKENHGLIEELRDKAIEHGSCLSDRFANSEVNQARALSEILEHLFPDVW